MRSYEIEMALKKRFLYRRGEKWSYRRAVPVDLENIDGRFPIVTKALNTRDIATAKIRRDAFAEADDRLWDALRAGRDAVSEWDRYHVAVEMARTMQLDNEFIPQAKGELAEFANAFNYAMKVTTGKNLQQIGGNDKLEEMLESDSFQMINKALMHNGEPPYVSISHAYQIYRDEIMGTELSQKSEGQLRKWRNPRDASVNLFIELFGDIDIKKITRENGVSFYKHIQKKINSGEIGANAANKKLTPMRILYDSYMKHLGEFDVKNPFQHLHYKEGPQKRRPPFSLGWIKSKLIQPHLLEKLNPEARDIWLALIDTGARPSEICNLRAEDIKLADKTPHIVIQPHIGGKDARQIKTETSIRKVPLVGLALDALRRHPNGFPRYADKEETLSATLRKWLKENDLKESEMHVPYSLRHSFEDRMKEAGIDEELRKILVGHGIDRPRYGEGGTLKWKQAEMQKLVFAEEILVAS